jgi:hypothetical protein
MNRPITFWDLLVSFCELLAAFEMEKSAQSLYYQTIAAILP